MYETLHCHTRFSDGELNHRQVLEICAREKISAVAFTDHDFLPDEKIWRQLKKWSDPKTNWVSGCELSSGLPRELGSGPASSFHIVGLFVDPFDKGLNEHCRKVREGRVERMKRMVKNMQGLGLKISVSDCLKEARGKTVGRAHICSALNKRKENKKVVAGLVQKMAQAAKGDAIVAQKYQQMLRAGERRYPYWLFLSKTAFISGVYADYLYLRDMDETVRLIRQAGGKAILAHWTLGKKTIDLKIIEKFFKEKRMDGAEVVFGRPGVDQNFKEVKKDMALMEKLTHKYGVIQGGGADLHKREEFGYFVKEKWFAEKTRGLVEKIIRQKGINLNWSSFKL